MTNGIPGIEMPLVFLGFVVFHGRPSAVISKFVDCHICIIEILEFT